MRYIYGPVQSRRLGASLGVSLTPYKICNFDCIYCQLGRTPELTQERKEYVRIQDILDELKSWLQTNPEEARTLNYVTLCGFGEPTLNSRISELIQEIRKLTPAAIAVITNASLLHEESVRREILGVDLIVPSLDAATDRIFRKIDRPHQKIMVEDIINGLISLRKEFRGKIWLEVMLVRGVNDSLPQVRKLKEAADRINPDKIQLNIPVRTTAEVNVLPPNEKKLKKIKEFFGDKCELV